MLKQQQKSCPTTRSSSLNVGFFTGGVNFRFSLMNYFDTCKLLSALKSWLQLILAKYDINGNYS